MRTGSEPACAAKAKLKISAARAASGTARNPGQGREICPGRKCGQVIK
jgi:hypothetical protein